MTHFAAAPFTRRTVWGALLSVVVCTGTGLAAQRTYEADVRPILKAHCFQCHGEAGEREGGLDLRLRRLIVAGGDSGSAIVPGEPANSSLMARIRTGEMPPGDDQRLSNNEIAVIEEWISAGAPTARAEPEALGDEPRFTAEERGWWSFQPLTRPPLPRVRNNQQVANAIDVFLLARLEKLAMADSATGALGRDASSRHSNGEAGGLLPATFAARAAAPTLVRRAAFDLLGLPPTPEDVDSFVADPSADAWARLIDRLLSSPHYGERWGRYWLDVAGYADSEGYTEEDAVRPHAYRYRDYVIAAFNADKRFDEFIVEQLAGDELIGPDAPPAGDAMEKLTATGYLRMAPDGTASRDVDQDLARNQVVADTVQIVGTSLLGLTIHCAQCHDHRYDPISQADYYRFRAIFEPALDWKKWKTPAARRISLYSDTDRQTRARLEAEAKQVDAERKRIADEYIARTIEQELLLVDDHLRDDLRAAYETAAAQRTDRQKQLLNEHPSVANISAGALYLYDRRREARARDVEAKRAEKLQQYLAAARTQALAKLPAETRAEVEMALAREPGERSPQQASLLAAHPAVAIREADLAPQAVDELAVYKRAAEEIRKSRMKQHLQEFTDKAAKIRAEIPPEPFVRALREEPGSVPATFVFHRGDHDQPKQEVLPAELSVLNPDLTFAKNDPALPSTGRRLQFARHLTRGRHPLVARVIVNRIWMHHFGRGLVNSPADFGVLGERPTHPKLLDWLAVELIDSGWSVKHVQRLVMTSRAYQQTSEVLADVAQADPDNHYYARMSVRRLDSDALRDAVLAVSGELHLKLYGEPVPVMEDEVGQIVLGRENLDGERKPTKPIPLGAEAFRRSVYVQARRSRPLAVFDVFDTPAMTPNCDQRATSNVAPQSLLLMNSQFVADYAERFAERLEGQAGSRLRDQVALGWRVAFGSVPAEVDIRAAVAFVEQQAHVIRDKTSEATAEDARRGGLASYCHALLSSNRFLYVE